MDKETLIKRLWLIFADMDPDDLKDEDLDLWCAVTKHSAVQNAIKQKLESEKPNNVYSKRI